MAHNAAFYQLHPVTSSVLNPLEKCGDITGRMGRGEEGERVDRGKERIERRKVARKMNASCSPDKAEVNSLMCFAVQKLFVLFF